MVQILLTILKILGIIILCILGLILVILLLVLFAPIRYKLNACKQQEQDGEISAIGRLTWLLFVLRCTFIYENGELSYGIRVFGIEANKFSAFFNRIKNRKRKKKKDKNNKPLAKKTEIKKSDKAKIKEPDRKLYEKTKQMLNEDKDDNEQAKTEQIKEKKLKRFFSRIKQGFINLKDKLTGIKEKILEIINKISYYKDELDKKENRQALSFIWGKVKEVLNHIKPTKIEGKLTFGMSSPDKTGQALGVIAIFYPVLPKRFTIKPDFTTPCLYGKIMAKGRIRIFTLLLICIKLIISDELKRIKKLIK